jgi:hypothetical protein
MTVTPDGSSVYEATSDSSNAGLAVFARETAPACQATSRSTAYQTPVTLTLSCADSDGDAVTRSVVSAPVHGVLSAINQASGTITYTPAAGYSGPDGFTFAASDGTNTGVAASAAVSVGAPPAQPKPAATPAVLSRLSESARRWRRGHHQARISKTRRPPVGTTFSFTLNEQAQVSFAFTQQLSGRRVAGRCVRPTKRNASKHRCKRTVTVGTLLIAAHAGVNKVRFEGRLRTQTLKPGPYTLVVTAKNSAGKRSAPQQLSFTIVSG